MTKKEEQKPPAFTLAMFLRSLLVGAVIALPLAFLNAPLWAFYVVPSITMAPWLVWELLHLEIKERKDREAKAPEGPRPRDAPRSVA